MGKGGWREKTKRNKNKRREKGNLNRNRKYKWGMKGQDCRKQE